MSARSISITAAYSASLSASSSCGLASQASTFSMRRSSVLRVLVAVGDHVLHQHDVAEFRYSMIGSLFSLIVQPAAERSALASLSSKACSTFRSGRPSISRMRPLKDVLLAGLGHRQQAGLDGVQRDGVHQVAQRHARLHLALEAHQHRFGHVQRHHAGGGAEGHQARAGREADADREARVAVAAGAHGVGQQQAVEPAVDHAVARAQRHAAAVADEGGSSRCIFTSTGLG
jgi:hypothetical protein